MNYYHQFNDRWSFEGQDSVQSLHAHQIDRDFHQTFPVTTNKVLCSATLPTHAKRLETNQ